MLKRKADWMWIEIMYRWKVVAWGASGGVFGGAIVFFLFHGGKVDIGSVADWAMIFVTGLTIYFGLRGVQNQIKFEAQTNKEKSLTFFSFEYARQITPDDVIVHHGDVDISSMEIDRNNIPYSKALPVFRNLGTQNALNVAFIFTFDIEGKTYTRSFQRGVVLPGDRVIILLPEWETYGSAFTQYLSKLELYYSTVHDDRVQVSWDSKMMDIDGKDGYVQAQRPSFEFREESKEMLDQFFKEQHSIYAKVD